MFSLYACTFSACKQTRSGLLMWLPPEIGHRYPSQTAVLDVTGSIHHI